MIFSECKSRWASWITMHSMQTCINRGFYSLSWRVNWIQRCLGFGWWGQCTWKWRAAAHGSARGSDCWGHLSSCLVDTQESEEMCACLKQVTKWVGACAVKKIARIAAKKCSRAAKFRSLRFIAGFADIADIARSRRIANTNTCMLDREIHYFGWFRWLAWLAWLAHLNGPSPFQWYAFAKCFIKTSLYADAQNIITTFSYLL